jgi:hypothetical protein
MDPPEIILLFVLLMVLSVSGGIGALIGKGKGRAGAGFVLGFFLSWIGWIIIAVMGRSPEAEARYQSEVANHRAAQRGAMPPGAPPQQPTYSSPQPGWNADPYGRHQLRYWDGTKWTGNVSSGGVQSVEAD